jgi:hypothetical protein
MQDQRLIRALNTICDTLYYNRNSQLRQLANAVFDLALTDGKDSLIGTVFRNQKELDHYFPRLMTLLGELPEQDVAAGEGYDLEDLAVLLEQAFPSLLADDA